MSMICSGMEITPVNPTVSVFVSKLNLERISMFLNPVPIKNYIPVKKSGIPFFGKNGIIVGVKSDCFESHGIRCVNSNSGSMRNCVSVDFQEWDRNFNIKVYKDKLHIVGTKSFKIIELLVKKFLDKLNTISSAWIKFFQLSVEERKNFVKTVILPIAEKDGKLNIPDDKMVEKFNEAKNKYYELRNVIRSFLSFIFNCSSFKEYKKKVKKICKINIRGNSIFTNEDKITVKKTKILECTYMGSIGHENILLSKLASYIIEKYNIDVTYYNERGKFVRITSDKLINSIMKKTSSRHQVHQISIFHSGHIRINSPANPQIVQQFADKCLSVILECIRKIEKYKDTVESVNSKIIEGIKNFDDQYKKQ